MDNTLKNKNCLVTGATGGIGKHIVKLLLKNQCNVFLTSKNNTNLKNFCKSLALKNSKISYFAADLTKVEPPISIYSINLLNFIFLLSFFSNG